MDKDLMKKKFGLPPMPPIGNAAPKRIGLMRKKDYSPIDWNNYFESQFTIETDDGNSFCAYSCGTEGPVVLFLHGGGFSGLSWALLSANLIGLVNCRCVAIDQRGHGDTKTTNEDNLSAEQLSSDVGKIMSSLYPSQSPPVILVGHSMGGAVAVHVAERKLIPNLIGLVVIDVVEGTALDALSSMQSFLRNRPKSFPTVDNAIEWAVRSGQIQNLTSAKVSMVGQLKCGLVSDSSVDAESGRATDVIMEEKEEEEDEETDEDSKTNSLPSEYGSNSLPASTASSNQCLSYTWRIDLSQTEKYWRGWFSGLSQKFLKCAPSKLLILAGPDRLDRDLTIGQMQGKFQMSLLPQCGHAVHEDVPDKVAEVLAAFMVRHKVAESISSFDRPVPGC